MLSPPALSPKTVTREGSPPKDAIFVMDEEGRGGGLALLLAGSGARVREVLGAQRLLRRQQQGATRATGCTGRHRAKRANRELS